MRRGAADAVLRIASCATVRGGVTGESQAYRQSGIEAAAAAKIVAA
jgi:hypothetical protein